MDAHEYALHTAYEVPDTITPDRLDRLQLLALYAGNVDAARADWDDYLKRRHHVAGLERGGTS